MGYIVFKSEAMILGRDGLAVIRINPMNNEQNLLAVEQIFAMLHGIRSMNLVEMWIKGRSNFTFFLKLSALKDISIFSFGHPQNFETGYFFYAHYSMRKLPRLRIMRRRGI